MALKDKLQNLAEQPRWITTPLHQEVSPVVGVHAGSKSARDAECLECVIERQERQEMLLANHDAWLEKEVRPSDVLHE